MQRKKANGLRKKLMDFSFTVTIMKLKKLTQLNLSPIRVRNQRMLAIKRMLRAKSRKAIGIGVVMPLASLSSCLLLIEVYTPLSPSQPYKYREDNTKQVEHASLSLWYHYKKTQKCLTSYNPSKT